jgi:hypothetical protein
MRMAKQHVGTLLATLLVVGGFSGISDHGWPSQAVAATQEQKAQAHKELDNVIKSLRAVDTAYASGNSAEAQTRFEQARTGWQKVSPAISAREAREAQLLFDSLGGKLKNGAPAKEVKSTVSGMLEELREDIAQELR